MEYFFVDTENVGTDWLKIAEVHPNSTFFLLFSEHNSLTKFTYSSFINFPSITFHFLYFKTNNQKNALDFELVKLLKEEMEKSENPDDSWYIISNDKGYKKHETKFGLIKVKVERIPTKKYSKQKEVNVENNCNEFPLTEMQKKELRRICNDYCFSWKRKEVSRKMKKSIAAIIHDTEYNLESFIFYYFTSPDSSWELIKKKK